MKVRMIQQMSGPRWDGSRWPEVGDTLDVSDEEGMALCRTTDNAPFPIAVPVMDEKAETPEPEDEKAETRKAKDKDEDPIGDPEDAPPPKRGPGRPRKDSLPK